MTENPNDQLAGVPEEYYAVDPVVVEWDDARIVHVDGRDWYAMVFCGGREYLRVVIANGVRIEHCWEGALGMVSLNGEGVAKAVAVLLARYCATGRLRA